jgi:rare lipoprotein A
MNRLFLFCILFFITTVAINAQPAFVQEGLASYYGKDFHGKHTSSGEVFSKHKLTAAHLSLDFGTMVKVTNLANGKSVVVRINDRGPFSKSRIIDLSRAAAQKLDMIASGTAKVRIETIAKQVQDTINQDTLSSDVKKEFFEIDVKTANHVGWAVQIGSFGESANLITMANHIMQEYNQHLLAQVATVKGIKVYRLLVGPQPSESEAKALLLLLKKEYPDSFVTSLN